MSSIDIAADFVRTQLAKFTERPLVVGLQGPQGSGKSYLASHLAQKLGSDANALRVVVLSIDDLYLPHSDLVAVANRNPNNVLLHGRGQPGTHDVQLGLDILTALREGRHAVKLPAFDKSLFNGEGDRLSIDDSRITTVEPPSPDVVLLEGWFVGFQPISDSVLGQKWEDEWIEERVRLGIPEDFCSKANIEQLNENLTSYKALWKCLDVFIQLKPIASEGDQESPYSIIYQWRLEQEHHMRSLNGNRGMTDEGVRRFVDRYIPGYVFFSGDTSGRDTKGNERTLIMILDKRRKVVETLLL